MTIKHKEGVSTDEKENTPREILERKDKNREYDPVENSEQRKKTDCGEQREREGTKQSTNQ